MKHRFPKFRFACSSAESVVGACLHAIPGSDRVQARSYSGQTCGALGLAWLAVVLAFASTLQAQEATPATQDAAPTTEVATPLNAQNGLDTRSDPAVSQPPETPAPVPALAPVAPASVVALEEPLPPAAPPALTSVVTEPEWIHRGEVVVFGNDVVIRENERASKVVAIGGDVDMRGRVDGELVAVGGDVKINGPVGELVAVFGDVTLGPKACVNGEAVAVLGELDNPHQVPIHGETVAVGGFIPHPGFGSMLAWAGDAVSHVRLLSPHIAWPWYIFGAGALFYLLLAAVFGRGINACARVLEESPGTTLATAIAMLPLLPLFTLLLICTVLGIVLLPFLAVIVLFAVAFGKAAVLVFLGRAVLRAFGGGEAVERAWLTVLIGAALLALLYCLPFVGLLVWALTSWVGLGMVVAAVREKRRRERAVVAPRPMPTPSVTAFATAAASAAPESVGSTFAPVADRGASAPEVSAAVVEGAASVVPEASDAAVPPVMPPPPSAEYSAYAERLAGQEKLRREVEDRTRGRAGAGLPRADFFLRLGALLIDIVLVGVVGGVSLAFALLPFPLLFGGYAFAMWQWKGTTVGGIIFNLQVVRLDGRPMDVATALVRTLVAFLSVAVAGLGLLWCLWDEEQQTWHDKVAGTVVVRVPKSTPLV